MVLTRVGVWSAAKIAGVLYAAMGLILGSIFALISVLGAGMASVMETSDAPPAWFGAVFGIGAIVLFPIFYGVMGVVTGAISAALYNVFAGVVGGLQLEMRSSSAT